MDYVDQNTKLRIHELDIGVNDLRDEIQKLKRLLANYDPNVII